MNILMSLISNSGYIIVNKEIIKKIGLHEAIILGELCSEYTYWEKNNRLENGYFFSTRENIEENTGLTPYQQREPFRRLVNIGIVLEKLKGMPHQKWYSLDMDKLYKFFNDEKGLISSVEESEEQDVKKLNNKSLRNLTPRDKETTYLDSKKFNNNNNNKNNNNNNNNIGQFQSKKPYNKNFGCDKDSIWYKDIKSKYGENFENLYANL